MARGVVVVKEPNAPPPPDYPWPFTYFTRGGAPVALLHKVARAVAPCCGGGAPYLSALWRDART